MYEFGDGHFFWLLGYFVGYHQIRINNQTRPKLAFAGSGASMYTYNVMLFGPVNVLVIFVLMMFNINKEWKAMAIQTGVALNEDTNTKIIVGNCFNWAILENQNFLYMEAQFTVAARCWLYCYMC